MPGNRIFGRNIFECVTNFTGMMGGWGGWETPPYGEHELCLSTC